MLSHSAYSPYSYSYHLPAISLQAAEEEGSGSAHASAPRYDDLSVTQSVAEQRLWRGVARQLRRLCADERPEVRTCAIHSMMSVLTAHGQLLSGHSWNFVMLRMVMPLLHEIAVRASTADKGDA